MSESPIILSIDDSGTVRTIVKKTVEKHGYQCLCAEDGETGLEMLDANKDIALVILDIKMPGLQGDEVLQKIRENPDTKNLPVIMLTGQNSLTELSQFLELGANDYMVKPFDPVALIVRLKVVLSKAV